MGLALFIIGTVMITFTFLNETKNKLSILMYKVFPFFAGLFIMYYSAKFILKWI